MQLQYGLVKDNNYSDTGVGGGELFRHRGGGWGIIQTQGWGVGNLYMLEYC